MLHVLQCRRFLQDHMRIRTTKSKRIYPHQTRPGNFWECLQTRRHPQFQSLKINVLTRRVKVQTRRNLTMLQHQQSLDQTDHSSSGLQMAQVRFH